MRESFDSTQLNRILLILKKRLVYNLMGVWKIMKIEKPYLFIRLLEHPASLDYLLISTTIFDK